MRAQYQNFHTLESTSYIIQCTACTMLTCELLPEQHDGSIISELRVDYRAEANSEITEEKCILDSEPLLPGLAMGVQSSFTESLTGSVPLLRACSSESSVWVAAEAVEKT